MKNTISLSLLVAIIGLLLPANIMANPDQPYVIGIGETVKLEITSEGRSILSWSTGKYSQWDVNALYLEVVSSSWDYAIVKGLKETPLTVVQLTVTHNHHGIYGDKYYDAFRVKVLPNGPTNIDLSPSYLDMNVGDYTYLYPTITPSDAITDFTWESSNPSAVFVSRYGRVMALEEGKARITVTTSNGLSDWCDVVVKNKTSIGLAASLEEEHDVEVYDAKGTCIFKGQQGKIPSLNKGLYIVKTGWLTHKLLVR